MKVFITGASGLAGRHLVKALIERGDSVVAVSRDVSRARATLGEKVGVEVIQGNPRHAGEWTQAVSGCGAVVNLAGEPVAGRRWNTQVKQEILASRVETTRNVAQAIHTAEKPPHVFVSASASGYYGEVDWGTPVNESHPAGSGFLAEVCQQWEQAAGMVYPSASSNVSPDGRMNSLLQETRTVILRLAIVLDSQGGALAKMLTAFLLGLGGPLGNGTQPFPWIHIDDLLGMIIWAIDHPEVVGVLNACAPEAVTQKQFAQILGRVLHRPALLPAPASMLKLIFGEGASVLLAGQRMIPRRAEELGYQFTHPGLEGALKDLLT